jgi:hypothetical protein
MIYSYFVEKLVRQSFANVQDQNYDEVLKVVVPNVTHHFAGDHALGGTRHDKETRDQNCPPQCEQCGQPASQSGANIK